MTERYKKFPDNDGLGTHLVMVDRNILSDPRLTWEAKGLYAYMMANSKDGKFDVSELDQDAWPMVDELAASGHFAVEMGEGND